MADIRIGHDFKSQRAKWLVITGATQHRLAASQIHAFNRRHIQRRRQIINHRIEQRLNALEDRVAPANKSFDFIAAYIPGAYFILGIGLFCGLWARNSGRDFWLWCVAGLVFNIFALLAVVLAKDKDDDTKRAAAKLASQETLDV